MYESSIFADFQNSIGFPELHGVALLTLPIAMHTSKTAWWSALAAAGTKEQ